MSIKMKTRLLLGWLFTLASSIAYATDIQFLEQNWSDEERSYFYSADQGSRLLPYQLFLHLEQAESEQLFRADDNMHRFGFIKGDVSKNNPDGLAIGLSRNDDFMGITCSACHTQQITYNNQALRIDGGQAFIDLRGFLTELTAALKATIDDPQKLTRLANKVHLAAPNQAQIDALKDQLMHHYSVRRDYIQANYTHVDYGYSRIDAFGAILNKALSVTQVKDNTNPANAPTSMPYIWDTPQHDYVEWNGAQVNTRSGALARNIGEALGVFGEVTPQTNKWLGLIDGGYPSSINVSNLRKLEKMVAKLHSPLWPSAFPDIDPILAEQGRELYLEHCSQCHVDINRTDPSRLIKVRMSTLDEIGTDPLMAENVLNSQAKTGEFEGKPRYYIAGPELEETTRAIYVANNLMVGVLKNNPVQVLLAKRDAKQLGHEDVLYPPKYVDGQLVEGADAVSDHALLAYKARPLNGVWSSAPYLHNGSVHNMYQLLLPASERDKTFHLGSWEYDPTTLGYVNEKTENSFEFDTRLLGNSNVGHEYGTGAYGKPALTEQQRWALIEYLKTL
jgi:hypothetical protein